MATPPVTLSVPTPMTSALKALQEANRVVARTAQDVAERGAEGLANNVVQLTTAELAAKASLEVARTARRMDKDVLDILA